LQKSSRTTTRISAANVRFSANGSITHTKKTEEWDRRRWGIVVLLAGTFLTSAAGLIVAWVKK
jgi:ABC-type phosphate transport system permease subunit